MRVTEDATGEVLYTVRVPATYQPPVFAPGTYTASVGRDRPGGAVLKRLKAGPTADIGERDVRL